MIHLETKDDCQAIKWDIERQIISLRKGRPIALSKAHTSMEHIATSSYYNKKEKALKNWHAQINSDYVNEMNILAKGNVRDYILKKIKKEVNNIKR